MCVGAKRWPLLISIIARIYNKAEQESAGIHLVHDFFHLTLLGLNAINTVH
jgi:hypothetical protein